MKNLFSNHSNSKKPINGLDLFALCLIFFVSTASSAQNFKFGLSEFLPNVLGVGNKVIKEIYDGVINGQKIREEAEKRELAAQNLLDEKKSYSDLKEERRNQLKTLNEEIAEHRVVSLRKKQERTWEELEEDLLFLLDSSSFQQKEEPDSLMISFEEMWNSVPSQISPGSKSWQIPGVWQAPNIVDSDESFSSRSIQDSENQNFVKNEENESSETRKDYPNLFLEPLSSLKGVMIRQNSPYDMTRLAIIPQGFDINAGIMIIHYGCVNLVNVSKRRNLQNPNLKLGGVLMDLHPDEIAIIIRVVTGIQVDSIHMFQKHQGRCALSLRDPEFETSKITDLLNGRLWFGPTYALYARSRESSKILLGYVKNIRRALGGGQLFPRHLVTVEPWVPRNLFCNFGMTYEEQCQYQSLLPITKTAPMLVNPLLKAPHWYQGSREPEFVEALEWELNNGFSNEIEHFVDVQAYAESRADEGWRIPTIAELESLHQQMTALNDDISTDWFWSSTPVSDDDNIYWGMNLEKGFVYYNDDYHIVKICLVRDLMY